MHINLATEGYCHMTWPLKVEDTICIEQNENMMIHWIRLPKLSDQKSMSQLRDMLEIPNIKDVIRYSRLRWFAYLEHMPNDNWPKKVMDFQVPGTNIRGS